MTTQTGAGSVIVTGGRGRLGRLVVNALRAEGVRTASLARSRGEHGDDVEVDLRDSDAVADIVAEIPHDAVIHLASVLRGDDLVAENLSIDRAVARASGRAGTPHVVNISSAAVYGTAEEAPRNEADPLAGTSEYALSKIRGEEIFHALAEDGTTSVTTLRVFNLAGPAFPDSLIMRLLTSTHARPVPLTAPDRFVRDYLHQSDAVALIRDATMTPSPGHRTLNIAGGTAVSSRMLLDSLGIAADRVVELPGPPSWSWADIAQMEEALGTRPRRLPGAHWAESFPSAANADV